LTVFATSTRPGQPRGPGTTAPPQGWLRGQVSAIPRTSGCLTCPSTDTSRTRSGESSPYRHGQVLGTQTAESEELQLRRPDCPRRASPPAQPCTAMEGAPTSPPPSLNSGPAVRLTWRPSDPRTGNEATGQRIPAHPLRQQERKSPLAAEKQPRSGSSSIEDHETSRLALTPASKGVAS
jgi:hypothetical protein